MDRRAGSGWPGGRSKTARSRPGTRSWVALLGMGMVLVLAACATTSDRVLRQADAHRRLAQLRMQENHLALALQQYRASLALYSRDPETHFGISEAYRRKGLFKLAESHLRRTIALDALNLSARLNLGVVYLQQERWSKAIRVNGALLEDPTFLRPARALVNRGWAHYKSGDLELAEADFRRALKLGGAEFPAHLNLGLLHYQRGDSVEAVREFEQAVALFSDQRRAPRRFGEAEARFHLAQAHVKLGQRARAIEHLEVAVERGGASEWGRKSREYLAVLQ